MEHRFRINILHELIGHVGYFLGNGLCLLLVYDPSRFLLTVLIIFNLVINLGFTLVKSGLEHVYSVHSLSLELTGFSVIGYERPLIKNILTDLRDKISVGVRYTQYIISEIIYKLRRDPCSPQSITYLTIGYTFRLYGFQVIHVFLKLRMIFQGRPSLYQLIFYVSREIFTLIYYIAGNRIPISNSLL